MGNPMHEEDMYQYIKKFLETQGYEVKGEVVHCDVMAVRDDMIVVIEMKLTLNLDVILQAVQRQRVADAVYIAVPKKSKTERTRRWQEICHLLKRLEIGLLVVKPGSNPQVEQVLNGQPFCREKSIIYGRKKRKAAFNEFAERTGDYNIGGCTRKKIITAYRQKAIFIASLLRQQGQLEIKKMKELGADKDKVSAILRDNYYGWFKRVARATYDLTELGNSEILQFLDKDDA